MNLYKTILASVKGTVKLRIKERSTHPQPQRDENLANVTFILDQTRERIKAQHAQVDVLEAKVYFVMGAATAIISAVLVLQNVLLPAQCAQQVSKVLQAIPIILLMGSI